MALPTSNFVSGGCRVYIGALPKRRKMGLSALGGGADGFARLEIVRRHDDGEVVNRAQRGEVVQRMMRAAERAVADAGADADEPGRHIRVADVVLDLLERPRREKAGRRNGERLLARRRQSGGDADQVLLGDADFDELFRQAWPNGPSLPEPRESLVTAMMLRSALASSVSVAANSSRFARPILRPSFSAIAFAAGENMEGAGALMGWSPSTSLRPRRARPALV